MGRGRKKRQTPSVLDDVYYNVVYPTATPTVVEVYQSIVCRPEYCQLSPEEIRWRHYLDSGKASLPVLTPSDTSLPAPAVDAGSVTSTSTSTCSLCAARFALRDWECVSGDAATTADGAADPWHEYSDHDVEGNALTGQGNRRTSSVQVSHRRGHSDRELRKRKTERRIRRLEKTVNSLSHGLILALTELKSGAVHAAEPRAHSSPNPVESDLGDAVDGLSTAFAGMKAREQWDLTTGKPCNRDGGQEIASVGPSGSTLGTSSFTSHATLVPPARQSHPTTLRNSGAETEPDVLPLSGESKLSRGTEIESDCAAIVSNRSPISGLLRPILNFMMCPEVSQFLKQVEAHPGLRSTQFFDLFWVMDNLFNVHGGIMMHCLRKSLALMDSISGYMGSAAWSQNPKLMNKLDEVYRKDLHPWISTDGTWNSSASTAWELYYFELAVIFTEWFPPSPLGAPQYFRYVSGRYEGCLNPVITKSYIEDLNAMWTEVHPALLEVTRWFEPFVDYGPDYHRTTPLYDATIALERRARELLSRRGVNEPEVSLRVDNLLQVLRKRRNKVLTEMQTEMAPLTRTAPRDFDETDHGDNASAPKSEPPSAEEAALVQLAVDVTGWKVTSPGAIRQRDALALHEVRVMKKYRPRLLRTTGSVVGTIASQIRREITRFILAQTDSEEGEGSVPPGEVVFWDGIV